jgi:hypothetical protein
MYQIIFAIKSASRKQFNLRRNVAPNAYITQNAQKIFLANGFVIERTAINENYDLVSLLKIINPILIYQK